MSYDRPLYEQRSGSQQLYSLILEGNTTKVIKLLKANPALFEVGIWPSRGDFGKRIYPYPMPFFHLAAKYKQTEVLIAMLELALDLRKSGILSEDTLTAAMQTGEHPGGCLDNGLGILYLVVSLGSSIETTIKIFDFCLKCGANIKQQSMLAGSLVDHLIHEMKENDAITMLRYLQGKGVDINAPNHLGGCNLYLISVNNNTELKDNTLRNARESFTPILVNSAREYRIYGDSKGDGVWGWTSIDRDTDVARELDALDLPFLPENRGKKISPDNDLDFDDRLFRRSLTNALKIGHAHTNGSSPLCSYPSMSDAVAEFLIQAGGNINAPYYYYRYRHRTLFPYADLKDSYTDKYYPRTPLARLFDKIHKHNHYTLPSERELEQAIFLMEHGANLATVSADSRLEDLFRKLHDSVHHLPWIIQHDPIYKNKKIAFSPIVSHIRYLHGLLEEKQNGFEVAKQYYVDAGANGNLRACVKLIDYYLAVTKSSVNEEKTKKYFRNVCNWLDMAHVCAHIRDENFINLIGPDKAILWVMELLEQSTQETEAEDKQRNSIKKSFEKMMKDFYFFLTHQTNPLHLSKNCLLLAHAFSRLNDEWLSEVPLSKRNLIIIQLVHQAYRQTPENSQDRNDAKNDLSHHMILLIKQSNQKGICIERKEESPIFDTYTMNDWYQLALAYSKAFGERPEAHEWRLIAETLSGTSCQNQPLKETSNVDLPSLLTYPGLGRSDDTDSSQLTSDEIKEEKVCSNETAHMLQLTEIVASPPLAPAEALVKIRNLYDSIREKMNPDAKGHGDSTQNRLFSNPNSVLEKFLEERLHARINASAPGEVKWEHINAIQEEARRLLCVLPRDTLLQKTSLLSAALSKIREIADLAESVPFPQQNRNAASRFGGN